MDQTKIETLMQGANKEKVADKSKKKDQKIDESKMINETTRLEETSMEKSQIQKAAKFEQTQQIVEEDSLQAQLQDQLKKTIAQKQQKDDKGKGKYDRAVKGFNRLDFVSYVPMQIQEDELDKWVKVQDEKDKAREERRAKRIAAGKGDADSESQASGNR